MPGSWPPSPGLAPWAILISTWSAAIRKLGVTPNRPDATCLILLLAVSPLRSLRRWGNAWDWPAAFTSFRCRYRCGSSPPSPLLLLPPSRFMAMAIASWVSRLMAPRDMPPVQKRCTMEATDSTWSMGIALRSDAMARQSRSVVSGRESRCSSNAAYAAASGAPPPKPTAACSSLDMSWLLPWYSSPGSAWKKPNLLSFLEAGNALAQKDSVSAATSSRVKPPMRDTVPRMAVSITSWPRPYTSKIWAPW